MNKNDFGFVFDNSFAREMNGFYVNSKGADAPSPQIVLFNRSLANHLKLDSNALNSPAGANILCGNTIPEGASPLSQVYAGHQFGSFSARLGDGRAMLLGEIVDTNGQRCDLQLKGSGKTEYSRGGDGKAALGPVLREYIMGEAMHGLGIATTRALAAVTTGEIIHREGAKPGAVLSRVASSHLRVGTFQYFAARGEQEKVRQLADYAISRHYGELAGEKDKYFGLLRAVINTQLMLVAKWVHVGFVHGVMNTDNMSISGETIDYGPCAFIDTYDPGAVFSSIDHTGRYGFGNQPVMAQWNLARFAEALLGIIEPDIPEKAVAQASVLINQIPEQYTYLWLSGMRDKIGLVSQKETDLDLVTPMLNLVEKSRVDYTH
ncbi:MAG: YdiU family protein, partial [Devosiaceae bacterium]|nr:YdiU family protein [Devosiaceae bacterium]